MLNTSAMPTSLATVSYEQAKGLLYRRKQVDYHFANFALTNTHLIMATVTAYRELYPDDFKERLKYFLVPFYLSDLKDTWERLQENILYAVNDLFPINTDDMFEEGCEPYIWIQEQNYSMSWDEYGDISSDPEQLVTVNPKTMAWPMFIWTMGNGEDPSTWANFSEYFGWGTEMPEWINRHNFYYDNSVLFKYLDKAGLGAFKNALKVTWKDTGNIFIDYDPYDESDALMPVPFTVDNILHLAKQYQEAQPMLAEYEVAMAMLEKDYQIFNTIAGFMGRSLKERK